MHGHPPPAAITRSRRSKLRLALTIALRKRRYTGPEERYVAIPVNLTTTPGQDDQDYQQGGIRHKVAMLAILIRLER